jgi:hypothetical protein
MRKRIQRLPSEFDLPLLVQDERGKLEMIPRNFDDNLLQISPVFIRFSRFVYFLVSWPVLTELPSKSARCPETAETQTLTNTLSLEFYFSVNIKFR